MQWLGGASYITAAVVTLVNGRTPTLAFIAAALTGWLVIVVHVESRSSDLDEASRETTNGWTTAHSARAVETIGALRELAFYAGVMRLALIMFGFLLMSWTLLP